MGSSHNGKMDICLYNSKWCSEKVQRSTTRMIRRLHTEEKRKTEQTTKNKQANKKANKKPISLAVFSVKKKDRLWEDTFKSKDHKRHRGEVIREIVCCDFQYKNLCLSNKGNRHSGQQISMQCVVHVESPWQGTLWIEEVHMASNRRMS